MIDRLDRKRSDSRRILLRPKLPRRELGSVRTPRKGFECNIGILIGLSITIQYRDDSGTHALVRRRRFTFATNSRFLERVVRVRSRSVKIRAIASGSAIVFYFLDPFLLCKSHSTSYDQCLRSSSLVRTAFKLVANSFNPVGFFQRLLSSPVRRYSLPDIRTV